MSRSTIPERELTELVSGEVGNLEVSLLRAIEVTAVARNVTNVVIGVYHYLVHFDPLASFDTVWVWLVESDAGYHVFERESSGC